LDNLKNNDEDSHDEKLQEKEELFGIIQQNEDSKLEQAQESLFRRLDEDTRIEIVRWVVISKELFGGKNE
tara:strand:+ start:1519 stop:1728 length:210 start_codon:yes stop_codon:yes gene_type:complete